MASSPSQLDNVFAFFMCIIFSVSISIGVFLAIMYLYIVPKIEKSFDNVTKNMNDNFRSFNQLNLNQASQITQDSSNISRLQTWNQRTPSSLF